VKRLNTQVYFYRNFNQKREDGKLWLLKRKRQRKNTPTNYTMTHGIGRRMVGPRTGTSAVTVD
jgi:hypothetical protein